MKYILIIIILLVSVFNASAQTQINSNQIKKDNVTIKGNSLLQLYCDFSASGGITLNSGTGFGITAPSLMSLGGTYTIGSTTDNLQFNNLGLNGTPSGGGGCITSALGGNNINGFTIRRATDVSPLGNFLVFRDAALTTNLFQVDINGGITGRGTDNFFTALPTQTSNTLMLNVDASTGKMGTQSFSTLGWSITGNSGTTAGTNFIGTSDDQDLVFKRNSSFSGIIDSASANTSLGVNALANNSGTANAAFGYRALALNSGSQNCAVGYITLSINTSGTANTAIGSQALSANGSGSSNVAIGTNSLLANISGDFNTAVGLSSLLANKGSSNVALGYFSGRYGIWSNKLFIDNANRTDSATQLRKSLLVGDFGTDSSAQSLRLNGKMLISNVPNGSASDSILVWEASTYTIKKVAQSSSSGTVSSFSYTNSHGIRGSVTNPTTTPTLTLTPITQLQGNNLDSVATTAYADSVVKPALTSISTTPITISKKYGINIYQVDCTSGDITINLPTASGTSGFYTFMKSDATVNKVIVVPNGSEKINGQSSMNILYQYTSAILYSNGSNFFRQ